MSASVLSRGATLTALRDRIRQIERPLGGAVLPFGVTAIDQALPGGGLALGALHEILGAEGDEEDCALPVAFAAAILGRLKAGLRSRLPAGAPMPAKAATPERATSLEAPNSGSSPSVRAGLVPAIHLLQPAPAAANRVDARDKPDHDGRREEERERPVLWCARRADLYGPGLAAYRLDPGRLVLVRAARDEDVLWAVEEGLRSPELAAVVGEIGTLPMVASRRLQLAAEHSGVTALLLRRWRSGEAAARQRGQPSAAATRWRVTALPSRPVPNEPGVGRPRWRVELLRCRGGVPGSWEVEVADASGAVSVPAGLADRPLAPRRRRAVREGAETWRRTG